jgi:malonyl CoA-acyl carrier protein transacylase
MALAGGANLILSPEININFTKSRMMAADGRCKTFDSRADGYVRGEGGGVVVLKRMRDAERDGDRIQALIRGSAVNQDGRSSGLTAPNGLAQEALLRRALSEARLSAGDIDYIEAHGTGTSLGDPIEAHALASVFGPDRGSTPLVVGSVKTNIGHLEAAAGIAGLIKTVLSLEHEHIPRHLHFRSMNPHIDWGGLQVEIPVEGRGWPRGERVRRAGVSSFGFSGTNAHVIVEEAPLPSRAARTEERPLHLLGLSARTPEALEELRERYREELKESTAEVGDICFTANAGRTHFEERTFYVGKDREQLLSGLERPGPRGRKEGTPAVAYLFSGQGAQYAGMGRELYASQPVFRAALDGCAEMLRAELGEPLQEVLWGSRTELLVQTRYTQPALFAVEWSLSELWRSWGLEPAMVAGHSVGEYVAATVAGVVTLEAGLGLIAARGRLMQECAGEGVMSAVRASAERVEPALRGLESRVSLGAVNAPESVVISGYREAVEAVEQRLRAAGVEVKRLAVSHGFHSPQMEEMEERFAEVASRCEYRAPSLQWISGVTGEPMGPASVDAGYWRRQVRQPVQWAQAMAAMERQQAAIYLEVGPGTTLVGLGRQCVEQAERVWVPSLRSARGEWEQILDSLGRIYLRGAEIDWNAFDQPYHRRRTPLPTYPFQRKHYWIQTKAQTTQPGISRTGWDSACETAALQAECARFDLDVTAYPARWKVLDRLADAYIRETLVDLGIFQTAGETHTPHSLAERCGIAAGYERLIGRWLRGLVEAGALRQDGERFTAVRPLPRPQMAQVRADADTAMGQDRVFLDYILRCGQNLVKILTGRLSALETIFPSGDFTLAEDLYERAPVSAYFRDLCRAALEGLVRGRRAATYRVLELGAGTGSTASALLPILPPDASEYFFTDVSDIFLNRARNKFAAYPFVRYGLLDVERDPAEQGYPNGAVDVVVATNVLHATRDLRATIQRVKSLLAPGGLLILCEVTTYHGWFDVTTGLIEGWQVFEDGLRGDHPLLSGEVWRDALAAGGFEAVSVYPQAGSRAEALGERVIVAKAPGESAASRRLTLAGESHSAIVMDTVTVTEPAAVLTALLEAPPLQRHDSLVTLMRQHFAEMLRYESPDQVQRKRRLTDLGIDSLMAIEFSGRLTKALHLEKPLPSTLVFDHPTLDALADYLEREVLRFTPAAETAESKTGEPAAPVANDARMDEIDQLSDEEVEALLLKKVKGH